MNRLADHARPAPRGAGGVIVGRSENGDRRDAQRRSDMHGARIVRQVKPTSSREVNELRERRPAGQIVCPRAGLTGNQLAQFRLSRRAENSNVGVEIRR